MNGKVLLMGDTEEFELDLFRRIRLDLFQSISPEEYVTVPANDRKLGSAGIGTVQSFCILTLPDDRQDV